MKLAGGWCGELDVDQVVDGVVVALALIPEAIAFSIIAGVDPKVGLYASFSIAVVIAFAGGRPGMISAATGAMALVMVTLVKEHGLQYLLAATVLTGLLQVLAYASAGLVHVLDAEVAVTEAREEPCGLLRITAPVDIGNQILSSILGQMRSQWPKVDVELVLMNRYVDLVAEGVDVAIRTGPLKDSTLIAKLDAESDANRFASLTRVLFDQAALAAGESLKDPAGYVKRLNALLLELSA